MNLFQESFTSPLALKLLQELEDKEPHVWSQHSHSRAQLEATFPKMLSQDSPFGNEVEHDDIGVPVDDVIAHIKGTGKALALYHVDAAGLLEASRDIAGLRYDRSMALDDQTWGEELDFRLKAGWPDGSEQAQARDTV